MIFDVVLTEEALDDLERLGEALLDWAKTVDDFDYAQASMRHLRDSIHALAEGALRCRKVARTSSARQLVVPRGRTGYIVRFEIAGTTVVVNAIRHQREDDLS